MAERMIHFAIVVGFLIAYLTASAETATHIHTLPDGTQILCVPGEDGSGPADPNCPRY